MASIEADLCGWGRYPVSRSTILRPERVSDCREALLSSSFPMIGRGAGLSYGDAALNGGGGVVLCGRLDRMLAFDPERGLIRVEAGVALGDIMAATIPMGWTLAVTPGSGRVTVGGAVAADVHGKNHHVDGSFGNHLESLVLVDGRGGTIECGPGSALFHATVGGMGLTGFILEATLKLRRIQTAFLRTRNLVAESLDGVMDLLARTRGATYSVAWLDASAKGAALGRGVVMLGEHAQPDDLPAAGREAPLSCGKARSVSLPCGLPASFVGRPLARAMNGAIWRLYRSATERVVPLRSFFHTLDAVDNWNRFYGRRGFLEYQVSVPEEGAFGFVLSALERLAAARLPSFLTSLKRLGPGNMSPLSFPAEGYAFSVDVPVAGREVFDLLARFDRHLAEIGGRVYLAKDARCGYELIDRFYPRRREWAEVAAGADPNGRFSSDMDRRLRLRKDRP